MICNLNVYLTTVVAVQILEPTAKNCGGYCHINFYGAGEREYSLNFTFLFM
jgi:hypothetical protein